MSDIFDYLAYFPTVLKMLSQHQTDIKNHYEHIIKLWRMNQVVFGLLIVTFLLILWVGYQQFKLARKVNRIDRYLRRNE